MKKTLAFCLSLLMLFLFSCGGGDVTTTTSTTASSTTTTPTTTTTTTSGDGSYSSPFAYVCPEVELYPYIYLTAPWETYSFDLYHTVTKGNNSYFWLEESEGKIIRTENSYAERNLLFNNQVEKVTAGKLTFSNATHYRRTFTWYGEIIDCFNLSNGWKLERWNSQIGFRLIGSSDNMLEHGGGTAITEERLIQIAESYISSVLSESQAKRVKYYDETPPFKVETYFGNPHFGLVYDPTYVDGIQTEHEGKTLLGYRVKRIFPDNVIDTQEGLEVLFDTDGNIIEFSYVDFGWKNGWGLAGSIDMEEINAIAADVVEMVNKEMARDTAIVSPKFIVKTFYNRIVIEAIVGYRRGAANAGFIRILIY